MPKIQDQLSILFRNGKKSKKFNFLVKSFIRENDSKSILWCHKIGIFAYITERQSWACIFLMLGSSVFSLPPGVTSILWAWNIFSTFHVTFGYQIIDNRRCGLARVANQRAFRASVFQVDKLQRGSQPKPISFSLSSAFLRVFVSPRSGLYVAQLQDLPTVNSSSLEAPRHE